MKEQNISKQYEKISKICLSKDCIGRRLIINNKDHLNHRIINIQEFMTFCDKQYQRVLRNEEQVNNYYKYLSKRVQKAIQEARTDALRLISGSEQFLMPAPNLTMPKFQFSRISDFYVNLIFNKPQTNPVFIERQINEFNMIIYEQISKLHKFINGLNNKLKTSPIVVLQPLFCFSKTNKNTHLLVSNNGMKIKRLPSDIQGRSVYGLINKPLNQEQNCSITFKIIQQPRRFIYFGVCDLQAFENYNFKGSTFKRNGKMYAIRQNSEIGQSAVSLHNSLKEYSDRKVVGWDFRVNDEICLQLKSYKNGLYIIFLWNDTLYFQMPLDQKTKYFYPFVGMKYAEDEICIVDKSNPYEFDQYPKEQFLDTDQERKPWQKLKQFQ